MLLKEKKVVDQNMHRQEDTQVQLWNKYSTCSVQLRALGVIYKGNRVGHLIFIFQEQETYQVSKEMQTLFKN